MFTDAALTSSSTTSPNVRKDAYFGQPLATCVRAILEHRGTLNQGAANSDEIYEALAAGWLRLRGKGGRSGEAQ